VYSDTITDWHACLVVDAHDVESSTSIDIVTDGHDLAAFHSEITVSTHLSHLAFVDG
jgi:hypothetical protein